jgi:endoglucanase
MRQRLTIACLTFAVGILLAFPSTLHAQTPWICQSANVQPVSPVQKDISIIGTQFENNKGSGNAEWHARGFVIRAFISTSEWSQANDPSSYNAQFTYGPAELAVIKSWGASMLRVMVSEKVLSNDQTWYTATERTNYMSCLKNVIQLARNSGFVVDINMQAETKAGDSTGSNARKGLATQQTKDAWEAINPWFKTDKGVIYELYNEPGPGNSSANWNKYLHNGDSANGILPLSNIISDLRSLGSKNVFLVDGLSLAKSLDGVLASDVVNSSGYPLDDPIENGTTITTPQIGYAVHPYPDGRVLQDTDFDTEFGNAHAQVPVVITEWAGWGTATGTSGLGLDGQPSPQLARLVNYVNTNQIGLSASTFDIPGTMVLSTVNQGSTDPNAWKPTYMNCYAAGQSTTPNPTPNVGTLLRNFFLDDYDATKTYVMSPDAYATGITCP